jgi:TonB family protein
MDAVTAVLEQRIVEPVGFKRRIGLSALAHLLVLPVLLYVTSATAVRQPDERNVMTISLGGAPGPQTGGMTPMGGRATEAAPPETLKNQANVAPMAKAPEMVIPKPVVRPQPPKPPRQAPAEAKGRTPPKAAETKAGTAVSETGATGVGFGLTTGGGGTGGYLDVGDFCCPEYLGTMLQLIQRNWSSKQQVAGETVVKFTIQRDGLLTNVEVEKSSGYFALDQTAQRALLLTRQLPPLPAQFTEPQLTVHLIFRYER